jgi:hypothetical protein
MRTQMLAVSAALAALLLAPAAQDATPSAFLPDLDGFSPRLDPVLQ